MLFTVQETIACPCQFPDQTKLYKTVLPLSKYGQFTEELTVSRPAAQPQYTATEAPSDMFPSAVTLNPGSVGTGGRDMRT